VASNQFRAANVSNYIVAAPPIPTVQIFADSAFAGVELNLHPIQQSSGDPVVRMAEFNAETGIFTVPGRRVRLDVDRAGSDADIRSKRNTCG
jgi:hypothetical protein